MIADAAAAQRIIEQANAVEKKEHVAPEAISPDAKAAKSKLLEQLDALEKDAHATVAATKTK